MDIRLQNALITKYADQRWPSFGSFRYDYPGRLGDITSEENTQDPVIPQRTQVKKTRTKEEDKGRGPVGHDGRALHRPEAAAAAAAAAAKSKEEEAAGRASLRGYLNPTTSSTGNMALYGGGGALLGGGLAALLSSPKNRKRNALMYALLGGGLGVGAKMLGDRYAAEPAEPAAPAGPGFLESILPNINMPPGGTVGY